MKRLFAALLFFPIMAGFSPLGGPAVKGEEAYRAGKYDEAVKEYEKAVFEDPENADAHYNLGGAYYKTGEYEAALKEFSAAAGLDPGMADAHYNEGNALFRLGRYDEALAAYGRADSINGKDADTKHNIEVTRLRIEKETPKNKPPKGQEEGGRQGGRDEKPPSGGMGKKGEEGGGGSGQSQQAMSDEELQALLERQAAEEKRLKGYFYRSGKKDAEGEEGRIEQMLRGFGFKSAGGVAGAPGAPHVEKDW